MNLEQFTGHVSRALNQRLEHDWPPPPWPWPKRSARRQAAADTLISGISGLASGLVQTHIDALAEATAKVKRQNAVIEGLRSQVRTLERVSDDRLATLVKLRRGDQA